MIVFQDIDLLQNHLLTLRNQHKSIGFVPTMGALHAGHLSLVELSQQNADITVVSIFVNPTQFNDPKDFEKYPVTTDQDLQLLEKLGCDCVFLPRVSTIYPGGIQQENHYDLGDLEHVLEGKFRPGHFQGVAQVVHRLLDIVQPGFLFLGCKDYQQVMVIRRLVEIIGAPVKVITGETFRESSGLAMSSRNLRLSEEQKEKATTIYKSLLFIKVNYRAGDFYKLEQHATSMLLDSGFHKVDYVTIADALTLQPPAKDQQQNLVALVAAFIGEVRLIDNMVLS